MPLDPALEARLISCLREMGQIQGELDRIGPRDRGGDITTWQWVLKLDQAQSSLRALKQEVRSILVEINSNGSGQSMDPALRRELESMLNRFDLG